MSEQINDGWDEVVESLEEEYGSNYKIKIKVEDKEKLDKDDCKEFKSQLKSLYEYKDYLDEVDPDDLADEIEISKADLFVREQIMSGKEGFSMLHVILAAYVRTVSQYPYLNRFVSGQRIFSRNKLEIIMTVKKEMNIKAPETCIRVIFEPTDTIYEVYEKFNAELSKIANDTGTDNVAGFFRKFPRLLFRFVIKVIGWMDYWGLVPQALMNALPFWGSMIITSMGSLGIKPIYHHLYNFGNLPIFVSYGTKRKVNEIDRKGNVVSKKVIDMKVVTDERICDGFEYATAFKAWKKYIENPEVLKMPPEEVFEDID
jgi:hypothetical protein